ncbi:MAG TPA: transporter [Saprospiraceae bacterium]|nr:transporter [Saprospiraceae bacterium]
MAFKITKSQDLGFGSKIVKSGDRLINKDGSFNIIRKGNIGWNAYQVLIALPMGRFILFTVLYFVILNTLFALIFLAIGIEQLHGVPESSFVNNFLYAFFFSIQTFTTVGYGGINPSGIAANMVASLGAMLGLLSTAIITGLFFARFSHPQSHISFSDKALICPYMGITSFQCRIVNKSYHKIINVSAQITMTWLEDLGNETKRRFKRLNLERNKIILFPMNWTIVHPITEKSPLYNKTLDDLKKMNAEFLVMISAYDESYNQSIHDNSSYTWREIKSGFRFKPMYTTSGKGPTKLYLDDLSEVIKVQ